MKPTAILALAVVLFASAGVHAGTGSFVREQAGAGAKSKTCVYEYRGSEVTITVPANASCPATVQVWDLALAVSPIEQRDSSAKCMV